MKKSLSSPRDLLGMDERIFNRDVSWLEFNHRVLHEAMDERTPLLERLRFIDIFRSNNDEFFMKRIGALLIKIKYKMEDIVQQKKTQELYRKLIEKVESDWALIEQSFRKSLAPCLLKEGIKMEVYKDLNPKEKKQMNIYFKNNIFPILTPLAVDSEHPFPFLSNLSQSVGVSLKGPKEKDTTFARIKIPTEIDQWIPLTPHKDFPHRFIRLEELIIHNMDLLFVGMKIEDVIVFRVTRNASVDEEGDDQDDPLEMAAEGLKERRFAPIVRFEYKNSSDIGNLSFLMDELELPSFTISEMKSFLRFTHFSKITEIKRNDLKFEKFSPKRPLSFNPLSDSEKDTLVHFPFESFSESVEVFLKKAVFDPEVMAIKMTLYRTDAEGRLIELLIHAVENKKQVAVIIELQARFDEERNIKWAQKLEDEGIHVSYGLRSWKTHAKMILVVRKERDKLKSYVNIGTGNFNSQTSKFYTDLSFFTSHEDIAHEVLEVFNYLTGHSLEGTFHHLLVAPFNMHKENLRLIRNEMEKAKKGKPTRIIAKMNALQDDETIEYLYQASQAGVQIQLIVRGFCCLRPGIKGLSENIQVYSLVGRFLEHSRIFYFSNGEENPLDGLFFLGSADWMKRNLFERVEVSVPIREKEVKKRLWEILQLNLHDNRHLWQLGSDGGYKQRNEENKKKVIDSQKELMGKLKFHRFLER